MRATAARRIALALLAPHLWIGATAALAALAVTQDYVAKSAVADRLLAIRSGPPLPVRIERFDASRHMHPGGEVSLLAELVPGPLDTVAAAEGTVTLLPLRAAGEAGLATAERGKSGMAVRPPARPDGAGRELVGYLALPASGAIDAVALRPVGAGRDGLVVAISGRLAGGGLREALPADGVRPVVAPFTRSREVALAPVREAGPARVSFGLAILAGLVATATTLRSRRQVREDDGWKAPAPARSLRFQPIAPQSEMSASAAEPVPGGRTLAERLRRWMPLAR